MRTQKLIVVAAAVVLALSVGAQADAIALQNATADFSAIISTEGVWTGIHETIDGAKSGPPFLHGWIFNGSETSPHYGAYETVSNASFSGPWTFTLTQSWSQSGTSFTLQKIRLSYTTDDRSLFADGLQNGGDVTANWVQLTPTAAAASNSTATINGDNSISWSPIPDNATAVYTVTVNTFLSNVTGFLLEVLTGPDGKVGQTYSSGTAVLTEFEVDAVPEPASAALLLFGGAVAMLRRRKR